MQLDMTVYTAFNTNHEPLGDAGALDGAIEFVAGHNAVTAADLATRPTGPREDAVESWSVYRAADLESVGEDAPIVGFVRATTEAATFG